jgi:hypothetical protein
MACSWRTRRQVCAVRQQRRPSCCVPIPGHLLAHTQPHASSKRRPRRRPSHRAAAWLEWLAALVSAQHARTGADVPRVCARPAPPRRLVQCAAQVRLLLGLGSLDTVRAGNCCRGLPPHTNTSPNTHIAKHAPTPHHTHTHTHINTPGAALRHRGYHIARLAADLRDFFAATDLRGVTGVLSGAVCACGCG